jgi:hypothetical protein
MAGPNDTLVANPHVVFRALEDEAILVDLESGVYFGLNAVGARVWELLQETTVGGACEAIAGEFDAPRDTIDADVTALVDELIAKGLVEPRSDPSR